MKHCFILLCLLAVYSACTSSAEPPPKSIEEDHAILLATKAFLKTDIKWRNDFRTKTDFDAQTGEWVVIFLKEGMNLRSPGGAFFVFVSKATGSIRTDLSD